MRATAMASPLDRVACVRAGYVVGEEKMRVWIAVAVRVLGDLWVMETMWAAPVDVRWVSLGGVRGGDGAVEG